MGNLIAGEIREVFRSESTVSYEWAIPNFVSMPAKVGDCYWSPSFRFFAEDWFWSIFPNGEAGTQGWIKLCLWRNVKSAPKPLRITLGIKKQDGSEEHIHHDTRLPGNPPLWNLRKFLRKSELLTGNYRLAPFDELIITCKMWIDDSFSTEDLRSRKSETENASTNDPVEGREYLDSEVRTQVSREIQTEEEEITHLEMKGVSALLTNFKDLLLSGDDHDVTIKVKDREFKAHKSILRARSRVFRAMFKHKMKESMNDSISIDDCDPDAFGEFLKYLYGGKVENISASIAMELYYASDKYDVSGLKEICIDILKTKLSATVVCDVISFAAEHNEEDLLQRAGAFFAKHLEEILVTDEWHRFQMENRGQASELCLTALQTNYKKIE